MWYNWLSYSIWQVGNGTKFRFSLGGSGVFQSLPSDSFNKRQSAHYLARPQRLFFQIYFSVCGRVWRKKWFLSWSWRQEKYYSLFCCVISKIKIYIFFSTRFFLWLGSHACFWPAWWNYKEGAWPPRSSHTFRELNVGPQCEYQLK